MQLDTNTKTEARPSWQRKRLYILAFLLSALSSTVVLKIGPIQYLELILAVDFLLVIILFFRNNLKVKVFRPFFRIGMNYSVFLCIAFFLGVFALRQDFFAFETGFFQKPLMLTISRMAELFLDLFYMLYLGSMYREDKKLCIFAVKTYYWVGIAGCLYSLGTLPLNILSQIDLGTYGTSPRFRGFNNEGGPFGLYLVSVWLLAVVMRQRNWISRRQFYSGTILLLICMIGSQSKAAFAAIVLLVIFNAIWILRGWKRWGMVAGMSLALIVVGSVLDFQSQIDAYIEGSAKYQEFSNLRSDDGNVVMGRVAGAVLGPRMIAEHPWVGIGWGNYPLVRDDPQYRRGTAFEIGTADAPSLGIIDYIVELGIPLCLYLVWIELKPIFLLRRNGADAWLVSLAMIQPVSNWVGAHLNLIHQWVVLGFALGIGFSKKDNLESAAVLPFSAD